MTRRRTFEADDKNIGFTVDCVAPPPQRQMDGSSIDSVVVGLIGSLLSVENVVAVFLELIIDKWCSHH